MSNFFERFKGRTSTMTKKGVTNLVETCLNPIQQQNQHQSNHNQIFNPQAHQDFIYSHRKSKQSQMPSIIPQKRSQSNNKNQNSQINSSITNDVKTDRQQKTQKKHKTNIRFPSQGLEDKQDSNKYLQNALWLIKQEDNFQQFEIKSLQQTDDLKLPNIQKEHSYSVDCRKSKGNQHKLAQSQVQTIEINQRTADLRKEYLSILNQNNFQNILDKQRNQIGSNQNNNTIMQRNMQKRLNLHMAQQNLLENSLNK